MEHETRRAVRQQLVRLDDLAAHPDAVPVATARRLLKHITESWRDLLSAHQPDAAGRCPVCTGWLRRRKWPCQVWRTAHRQFLGDPGAAPAGPEPSADTQPRNVVVVPRQASDEQSPVLHGTSHATR